MPSMTSPPPLWFVTNGAREVGPVRTNLLLRGISYDRVPSGSYVRELHWRDYRPISQIREVRRFKRFAARQSFDWRPDKTFRLPTVRDEGIDVTREALTLARDPGEIMLFGLQTAMRQTHSQYGMLHRFRDPWIGMVTSYVHGPGLSDQLGQVVPQWDSTFQAACCQRGVIGRALVGEAQRATARRLDHPRSGLAGVAMLPLVAGSTLLGMLELGRIHRGFRSTDKSLLEGIGRGIAERFVNVN